VSDVVSILEASLIRDRLTNQTIFVIGPERLTMRDVVKRIAAACGRPVLVFPMPVVLHRVLAAAGEAVMEVPLVARAQVRMLAEGLCEPALPCDSLPADLLPKARFTIDAIRAGLPPPGRFTLAHLKGKKEET
jgi:NADH dehydrogenase